MFAFRMQQRNLYRWHHRALPYTGISRLATFTQWTVPKVYTNQPHEDNWMRITFAALDVYSQREQSNDVLKDKKGSDVIVICGTVEDTQRIESSLHQTR